MNSYMRGHGEPVRRRLVRRRRVIKMLHGDETRLYKVEFRYPEGMSETISTTSRSPEEAVAEADDLRKHQDLRPSQVLVKNAIGQILKRAAGLGVEALKKAGKVAKASVEAVKKLKAGMERAMDAYANLKDPVLNSVLRRAYSENLVVRTKARAELRRKYPEVYAELKGDLPPTRLEVTWIEKPAKKKAAKLEKQMDALKERIDKLEAKQSAKVAAGKKPSGVWENILKRLGAQYDKKAQQLAEVTGEPAEVLALRKRAARRIPAEIQTIREAETRQRETQRASWMNAEERIKRVQAKGAKTVHEIYKATSLSKPTIRAHLKAQKKAAAQIIRNEVLKNAR